MIDPIVSLAFSMHSAKGVYTLLLGSGVSKAAGVKTGWEITLDLIDRLAKLDGEDCGDDPEGWYEHKYGRRTDYSSILAELGRKEGNRRDILRRYFEPDEQAGPEDKRPTIAHKRIAELVKAGYIRVILTTNFDRLMEQALEAEGVRPAVIKKQQDLRGARPLQHERCTVIKLHGDYLDTELRNTEVELSKYHRDTNKFLDRVLDEYGMIICGWSAEYDHALTDAMRRRANHRYACYWTIRGQAGSRSEETMTYLDVTPIQIQDADQFFDKLSGNVFALEEIDRPHPLTAETAAARLRTLMADHDTIRIERMLSEEVHILLDKFESDRIFDPYERLSAKELDSGLRYYSASADVLRRLFSTGFYYRHDHDLGPWAGGIANLGFPSEFSGVRLNRYLMLLPALLCFYSAGVSALARGRYDTLHELFWDTPMDAGVGLQGRKSCLAPLWWGWWLGCFRNALTDVRTEPQSRQVPEPKVLARQFHSMLHGLIRETTRDIIRFDERFDEYFDRFEYIAALILTQQETLRDKSKDGNWHVDVPLGLFGLKDATVYSALPVVRFFEESALADEGIPPSFKAFKEGLSKEDFEQLRTRYNDAAKQQWTMWNTII